MLPLANAIQQGLVVTDRSGRVSASSRPLDDLASRVSSLAMDATEDPEASSRGRDARPGPLGWFTRSEHRKTDRRRGIGLPVAGPPWPGLSTRREQEYTSIIAQPWFPGQVNTRGVFSFPTRACRRSTTIPEAFFTRDRSDDTRFRRGKARADDRLAR